MSETQVTAETIERAIRQQFSLDERPEHVEDSLRPILRIIQSEVGLSETEWIEVFEELRDDVEFREAEWFHER